MNDIYYFGKSRPVTKGLWAAMAVGLVVTLGLGPRAAEADFLHWQGGSGNLLDQNWYNETLGNVFDDRPFDGDELNIGADGQVTFNSDSLFTGTAHILRVGHPFPGEPHPSFAGPATYTQDTGSLTVVHHAAFGVEHPGAVELSGDASFSVLPPVAGGAGFGALFAGFNAGDETTLVVKDNASVTAGFLGIGVHPDAPGIEQTAPAFVEIHDNASVTLNNGDRVIIGWFGRLETGAQSEGTLTMTGGSLTLQPGELPFPDLVVGWDGIATLNMEGGVIDVANTFITAIARFLPDPGEGLAGFTSQATVNHSGGTINAARMFVAERGESEYNLSGTGEINLDLRLVLGLLAPGDVQSEGTFTQSGGVVNTNLAGTAFLGVGMLIGERGHGVYNLESGVLNVTRVPDLPEHPGSGTLWLGEWETSTGQLNISGGTANIGWDVALSLRGDSSINQSDGQMNIANSLLISNGELSTDATGTYEISGGELNVGFNLVVGLNDGQGRFRVIGGDGQITVGNDYFQDPNGLLYVEPDSAGLLSLIDVAGNALFHAGTTLEANFDNFPGFGNGDFWDVLTAANITDNGINLIAPLGIEHRIVTGAGGEILQLFAADVVALPGDFNNDGVVDAADYVWWRKNDPGNTTAYDQWRANFGTGGAGGSSLASDASLAAVPEPATSALVLIGLAGLMLATYRRS